MIAGDFAPGNEASILTVAVAAPSSAIDPHLREFEDVGVGLFLAVEGAAAPAEDRNAFFTFLFDHDNGRARNPIAVTILLGVKDHAVAAVSSGTHNENGKGQKAKG